MKSSATTSKRNYSTNARRNRSEEEDWEILHNLGLCHLYTREWDAARECLDRALTLNRHQQTYTVLGRVYLMSGDVAAAVNVYKEAVK